MAAKPKSMTRRRHWRGGGLVFLGTLAAGMLGVLGWCWTLQYYDADGYRQKAGRQQLKIIPHSARRGMIVDRRGRTLAVSVQAESVRLDPVLVEDAGSLARELGRILSIDPAELLRTIQNRRRTRFVWIKRFVSTSEARQVRQLGRRGVVIESEYRRQYPMGALAAHVVGYTTIDGEGLEGIEAQYQQDLAGRPGQWLLYSDACRRPVAVQQAGRPARDGLIVVSTIDAVIQSCLEEKLQAVVREFHAQAATGIVMNPQTGEVLALANVPTFDLNQARRSSPSCRRNQALTDPVEPGSTFKPFTVAAALDGGFVTAHQKIFCHNGRYAGRGIGVISEYGNHGYGSLTVAEIIMRSSNIGSALIAQKMGKTYFYDMISRFGFGRRTGIDLPGEGAGILRPLAEWKWGQYALTRAAYGQGPISTTPIQLMRGFCCIVNGGRLLNPRVVRGLLGPEGQIVRDLNQEYGRLAERAGPALQVIKPQVSRQMVHEILKAVVDRQGGTAHNAYLDGYEVFGKTGTAQMAVNGVYQDGQYVSSFIAGAPAWQPRVCVLIMVRQPDRSLGLGYTGGKVAAPAVKEVLQQTLAYLEVQPRTEPSDRQADALAAAY